MSRDDLVLLLVLGEIADDYEEPNHVFENVRERARLCGISVDRGDVLSILKQIVELGLGRAYHLTSKEFTVINGFPPVEQIEDSYFLITPEGTEVFVSRREQLVRANQWPFDDEGNLMAGWRCPVG